MSYTSSSKDTTSVDLEILSVVKYKAYNQSSGFGYLSLEGKWSWSLTNF